MMRLLGGAIGSFIAIVCFAIIIECPKKYLPLAGVIGAVGGTVYLFCLNIVKTDAVLAAFFSALAITILSHIFAKGFRAPVTIFLIPGILPTVSFIIWWQEIRQNVHFTLRRHWKLQG